LPECLERPCKSWIGGIGHYGSRNRLELQVESQATKANNQLDKLVVKLDKVSGALSKLNGSGLSGLANGVSKFAQASAQLSNVKTADFTRLTKNIQSLSNINTQQIYGAASAMKTLSTAINSLGGVSSNSLQVAEVAKSISKLGGAVERCTIFGGHSTNTNFFTPFLGI